jgi:Cd2+/Zn2+-exporting ATPase
MPIEDSVMISRKPSNRRFLVKNLDCASCAAKIEKHLNQTDGISDAVIDFASLTLHVTADDDHPIVEAVRRVDPHIELISHSKSVETRSRDRMEESLNLKNELALLLVASVLFGWQLFFEMSSYLNPLAIGG